MNELVLFGDDLPMMAQATREEAAARAGRIRTGMVAIATLPDDVKAAWASRDWASLGYPTWDAYVEGEFGEHRLPMMSREQRRDLAVDLRGGSMSTRAIAAVLGVDQTTVVRDLNSTDANASVERLDRITGIDGKDRPATRPTPPPRATPASPPWPSPGAYQAEPSGEWPKPAPCPSSSPESSMFDDEIVDGEIVGDGPSDLPPPPTPVPAAPVDPEAAWSDDERRLAKLLRDGETVVLTLRGAHQNLIRWAETHGLYLRIDRRTEWGNPFEMPGDGDRDAVIGNYAAHYLPYKQSLESKRTNLVGKALGCWCKEPGREVACHGDVLKAWAEDDRDTLDDLASKATLIPGMQEWLMATKEDR